MKPKPDKDLKALLAAAPLDGDELRRARDFARPCVQGMDDGEDETARRTRSPSPDGHAGALSPRDGGADEG